MQTADREEFETQLAKLCAGYNLPVTTHRKDAYWSGLAKMTLAQLARCIDHALSEEGPDEMPTVKGIWRIHKELRVSRVFEHRPPPGDTRDHVEFWANRLLVIHVTSRGGLRSAGRFVPGYGLVDCKASAELEACLKLKRELIDWFVEPIREGDPMATPAEFLRQWIAGLQAVSKIEKPTYEHWCEMLTRPEMDKPFEPFMGRALEPERPQQQLLARA